MTMTRKQELFELLTELRPDLGDVFIIVACVAVAIVILAASGQW